MKTTQVAVALVASLCVATTAFACLWDSDTLQMERLRFPGVLEIITGKFVRHSKAYYEWRIPDRLKKLEAAPDDPALIDDLAVAYDKLGRPEEGIVLLEKSLEKTPDRYETLSNLATLLFHAGKLEESKQYVQRALEINPNAHFGREKYQLLLTEYVLQSELNTSGVLSSETKGGHGDLQGFARFVIETQFEKDMSPDDSRRVGTTRLVGKNAWTTVRVEETRAAAKGVLGMMHFADFKSPILLEALGDLLLTGRIEENGTQLAARAFLLAAKHASDPEVASQYREMASDALSNHGQFTDNLGGLETLEKQLAWEAVAGDAWFAKIAEDEKRWIAENRDVDQEFAAVYLDSLDRTLSEAESTAQVAMNKERWKLRMGLLQFWSVMGLVCVIMPLSLIAAVVYRIRLRRNALNHKLLNSAKTLS